MFNPMGTNQKLKAYFSLIVSALFFGSTFLVVKNLLINVSPVLIVFARFFIASILFLIIGGFPKKQAFYPGVLMGFFLWLGYITQTQGLITTSTVNSGVVTGFYIVLTPYISKILNKQNIPKRNYIFSIVGFFGIVLISINNLSQISGNLFTLLCALSYAIHIVLVERYVNNFKISQLMFVQSLAGSILCLPFLNFKNFIFSNELLLPILFLGLVVNVAAFYLQLYGQKVITASTSALILSLEAIFALLIGILIANEILDILNWFGVLLVLLSIFYVIKE